MEYLYGIKATSLSAAEADIAALTGLNFKLHESSFRAGDYYLHQGEHFKEIIIQRNYDEVEDEWFEKEFSEFPFIVYWNFSSRELGNATTRSHLTSDKISLLRIK